MSSTLNHNSNQSKHSTIRKAKKKFTPEEDQMLTHLVLKNSENSWEEIADQMPGRNARQCKDRWQRYLSPDVNKSEWTHEEEQLLIKLVHDLNGKWVKISKYFQGRNDNQIKNKWNVLKKRIGFHDTKPEKTKQTKVTIPSPVSSPLTEEETTTPQEPQSTPEPKEEINNQIEEDKFLSLPFFNTPSESIFDPLSFEDLYFCAF